MAGLSAEDAWGRRGLKFYLRLKEFAMHTFRVGAVL